ncbi:hypothetical protein [Streptomyces sp. NRRL S-118]|uniref:hypothetical protein n=1 Tax=Streptomyces sp. NRRL S-118 TaxID=1463881 RepID=UPI0004C77949|nr:hypothetical protein [Streptomyces sp. NRRL S-118]
MHPDIHRQLHALRAAELHRAARPRRRPVPPRRRRPAVRVRVGWVLVELGLRLVRTRGPAARTA